MFIPYSINESYKSQQMFITFYKLIQTVKYLYSFFFLHNHQSMSIGISKDLNSSLCSAKAAMAIEFILF